MKTPIREKRTLCLPFDRSKYDKIVADSKAFRRSLNAMIRRSPELFPDGITGGYTMKDSRKSKKRRVEIRRIKLSINGKDYSIRPSFVMPYMTGFTDDVEKALYLRKDDVPFPALSYVFGHSPMYWYRLENHLGRYSLVGTTLHKNTGLPQHLVADEKHTSLAGEKCYVATTVANNCILGVSVAKAAGEIELTKAYGVFAEEAKRVEADYKPKTVNTDGWPATQKAWQTLFSTVLIICCFLHIFIKIRDRAKMKFHDIYLQATTKLWDCYRVTTKQSFSQRIRRLAEWCNTTPDVPAVISGPIKRLSKNKQRYAVAYDQPGCHRTSNMLDRLMQRMDRHLFDPGAKKIECVIEFG